MDHGVDGKSVGITTGPSDKGFAYWQVRPYVSESVRQQISKAQVLLVPTEGFRDRPGPIFPSGTEELLSFLRDEGGGLAVDICIDDMEYVEYSLYGVILTIATIVASNIVAPLVVDKIKNYLNKRKTKPDTEVRFRLIVDRGAEGAVEVSYDGPAHEFGQVTGEVLEAVKVDSSKLLPPKNDGGKQ